MRTAVLSRDDSSDQGTFGTLTLDNGWSCQTGELPWRNNEQGKSCIPAGSYMATYWVSQQHGPCLMLHNVTSRTDVEIHAGNWCGDTSAGYRSDVLGCIIVGERRGVLGGQKAVITSASALQTLLADLELEDMQLTITENSA